jgi:hypothetical protein
VRMVDRTGSTGNRRQDTARLAAIASDVQLDMQ